MKRDGVVKEQMVLSIEGNPFIIRFKTTLPSPANALAKRVLKVIHL